MAGADAKCQALAGAAELPGTYRAWLSDDTSSPATRFTNTANTGPYVLLDPTNTAIAADWDELTSGTLQNQIDYTELGGSVPNSTNVWTNTLIDGTSGGDERDCLGWTSSDSDDDGGTGNVTIKEGGWTWAGPAQSVCGLPHHLYCFQQG